MQAGPLKAGGLLEYSKERYQGKVWILDQGRNPGGHAAEKGDMSTLHKRPPGMVQAAPFFFFFFPFLFFPLPGPFLYA